MRSCGGVSRRSKMRRRLLGCGFDTNFGEIGNKLVVEPDAIVESFEATQFDDVRTLRRYCRVRWLAGAS